MRPKFDFDFRPTNLILNATLGSLGSSWLAPALRHWFWSFTLAKNQLCDYEAKILILIFGPQIWLSMQRLAHLDHIDLLQPYTIGFGLTHWPKTNFAISRPKNWFLFLALIIDFKCNAWLTWIILTCPSLTPLVLIFHIGQKPTLRLWGQNLILIFGPQIWLSMQRLAHLDHIDLLQPYTIVFGLTHWPKTNFAIMRPKFWFWFSALKFDYQCNAWLTWIILTCSSLTPLVLALHIGQKPTLRFRGQNFDFDFRPSNLIINATLGSLGSSWLAPVLRHWFWSYTLAKNKLCDFEAKILILISGPQNWFSMQRLAHLNHLDLPPVLRHWFSNFSLLSFMVFLWSMIVLACPCLKVISVTKVAKRGQIIQGGDLYFWIQN